MFPWLPDRNSKFTWSLGCPYWCFYYVISSYCIPQLISKARSVIRGDAFLGTFTCRLFSHAVIKRKKREGEVLSPMWQHGFHFYILKEWQVPGYHPLGSRWHCGDVWWVQFTGYSVTYIIKILYFIGDIMMNLGRRRKRTFPVQNQLNSFFFFLVSFIVFDKYRHCGTKTFICCEVVKIYPTEFTYQYSFQTVSSYHQLSAQSCWLHTNKQIAGSDLLCQLQSENIKLIIK